MHNASSMRSARDCINPQPSTILSARWHFLFARTMPFLHVGRSETTKPHSPRRPSFGPMSNRAENVNGLLVEGHEILPCNNGR